ncbi:MAG: double-strand break repair helicase AddA [Sulfitobacter sp.]|nr:double-strand break repair helicase AddA [Sulfitobacter sp.]
MSLDDATRAQVEAARPDASTWLAANAGSGKTRVLTDRVARLLLDGVVPQHVLCLTYTKAAASEMQNRLFKRLGEWAMLPDKKLRQALRDLGIEGDLPPPQLRQARTLFAQAIETPGGLKIQTIHSFCAALLRRFPLEAGVSPQFTEVEERAADLLRAEIVDEMARGKDAPLVDAVAAFYTGEDFSKLTREIVGLNDLFAPGLTRKAALALFGQPDDLTHDRIEGMAFDGDEQALIQGLLPLMQAGGPTDQKNAESLGSIARWDISALPILEGVFLSGSAAKEPFCAKLDSVPTKALQKKHDIDMAALNDFMERIEVARAPRLALEAVEKTLTLHAFARRFLDRYAQAKAQRGWLDFDDLILKARALVTDREMASWVLYRIDGGIDHVLVDEAQDTSPQQWDVIERLTDEFFSGAGVRPEVRRTIFVVGDKKQSIYSFQGAEPQAFDSKAVTFAEKVRGAEETFQRRSLDYSFRSSGAILRLVDQTFDPDRRPGFGKETEHIPFHATLPGRVDLWPPVLAAPEEEEETHWTDTFDRISARAPEVMLAEQIAARIETLCNGDHTIPAEHRDHGLHRRPIEPGDFLILVQRRSLLFSQIIRACKARGLPIAGADRLKVGAELAVKDLGALLSFLATPDDDLSLAIALKSPLFGWDEQQLFTLAHGRDGLLWEKLRNDTTHPETVSILRDLRREADFLRPYDLIERILTRHAGRDRLLARLGAEAEDGINALLAQALSYERSEVPSLTGFLQWMETDDLEIKRQIDSASNQIRVMTVHGAKGLEAPIVILPDTGKRNVQIREEVLKLHGHPVWKTRADATPDALAEVMEDRKEAERAERLRLLYVALTRAEKWLMVASFGEMPKDGSAWYQMVEEAMGHVGALPQADGSIRFEGGDWDALPLITERQDEAQKPTLEPVFSDPEPIYCLDRPTLSPSDLGGAKALRGDLGEESGKAKAYGTYVHALLERLPPLTDEARAAVLPTIAHKLEETEAQQARAEALATLAHPDLATLFAPDTRAEVPLSARIGETPFYGLIDRLIVTPESVTAVDFKTNRTVPDSPQQCPEGLLRQMGAYALMLQAIYPNREIVTAILWTATGDLMSLPQDLVTEAFARRAVP